MLKEKIDSVARGSKVETRIEKLEKLEKDLREVKEKVKKYRELSKKQDYKVDSLQNNASKVDTLIRTVEKRKNKKQSRVDSTYIQTVDKEKSKKHLLEAFDLGIPYDEDEVPQVYHALRTNNISFAVEFGSQYRVVSVPSDKVFYRFVVRTMKISDKDLQAKWREKPTGSKLYMELVPPPDNANTWYFRLNLLQGKPQYYTEKQNSDLQISEYNHYKPRPHQVATLRSSNNDISAKILCL